MVTYTQFYKKKNTWGWIYICSCNGWWVGGVMGCPSVVGCTNISCMSSWMLSFTGPLWIYSRTTFEFDVYTWHVLLEFLQFTFSRISSGVESEAWMLRGDAWRPCCSAAVKNNGLPARTFLGKKFRCRILDRSKKVNETSIKKFLSAFQDFSKHSFEDQSTGLSLWRF